MKSSSPGLSSPSFQETLEMRAAGGRDSDDRQQSDEESGSASEPERDENSDSDNKEPPLVCFQRVVSSQGDRSSWF